MHRILRNGAVSGIARMSAVPFAAAVMFLIGRPSVRQSTSADRVAWSSHGYVLAGLATFAVARLAPLCLFGPASIACCAWRELTLFGLAGLRLVVERPTLSRDFAVIFLMVFIFYDRLYS
jgi:hypothetical protein